jgi:hypothetical protein
MNQKQITASALAAARELAMDSAHIPLIQSIIVRHFRARWSLWVWLLEGLSYAGLTGNTLHKKPIKVWRKNA